MENAFKEECKDFYKNAGAEVWCNELTIKGGSKKYTQTKVYILLEDMFYYYIQHPNSTNALVTQIGKDKSSVVASDVIGETTVRFGDDGFDHIVIATLYAWDSSCRKREMMEAANRKIDRHNIYIDTTVI